MDTNNWKTYESIKCTLGTGRLSNLFSLTLDFLFDRLHGEVVEYSTKVVDFSTADFTSTADQQ